MGIIDLFSTRQKKLRGDVPDVYIYDKIPSPLRVQIVHIWRDTLGNEDDYRRNERVFNAYKFIFDTLCREYGTFRLSRGNEINQDSNMSELMNFILQESVVEKVLDAIELSFFYINAVTRGFVYLGRRNAAEIADGAIVELNSRLQAHGVGYQFIDNKIIRIDSKLLHSEVVKPALVLLHDNEYEGAQAEFLKAHEHYRHGNTKESLNECLKAFESTMKAILSKRKWEYSPTANCSNLIGICLENGLIPSFWTQHFSALRSTLESGVPTARNKLGGHGQGVTVVDVPEHLAAYVLHMTAACIVFLVESEKMMP